ncbi:MAG TPA: pyrimidine dimer DNA glycosylase/endonuclease V [Usitatibacter sp.]|nr:pyrimidine dimer DNA glycosylase/endonuclease V [Usitatibacter sp.]
MRLWTLHPKYLDPQGLVALWREALLAKAVLRGETKGYRHHPQLERFKSHPYPRSAINAYLRSVHDEATRRGYSFDGSKIGPARTCSPIHVTSGQVEHEWRHLLAKLRVRSPDLYRRWRDVKRRQCHPSFRIVRGGIEPWESVP